MADKIEYAAFSLDGTKVTDLEEPQPHQDDIEHHDEAKAQGQTETWTFWQGEIQASLTAEKRFRAEADAAEKSYFGDDDSAYTSADFKKKENQTNIIHANIETLKPLVYSDTPTPIVRRRFTDGGDNDPTDRVAAIVAQRFAEYLVDTSGFSSAMELARDDWLIPGRGSVRVLYHAEFEDKEVPDPQTGQPVIDTETGEPFKMRAKKTESIIVRHWPYRRILFSANNTWDESRWVAFETPLTKSKIAKRFGHEKAEAMNYPLKGLRGAMSSDTQREMAGYEPDQANEESGAKSVASHDQCMVMEIWDKDSRKIIWWSPHYREDILDETDDVLHLENFWNTPKPLLAITLGGSLIPRPEMAYYRARAEEVDIATTKMRSILNTISLSGAYPGAIVEEIKELLDGKTNKLVAIENWMQFMEKGGAQGIIQWLPIDMFVQVAQALAAMRDQAKYALYEISGISDIIRGQGDPNETATAQQIKGNYANLRLRDKQAKMHRFALETIQIMVELGVEHYDTETIAAITNVTLPMTDADLERANQAAEAMQMQYQEAMQMAQASGAAPPPAPPEMPFTEQTSWERVHGTLKDDMKRKFALIIETDGTILADMEQDKKARIEFLETFAAMSERLIPMARSGLVDMKLLKEVMLFAVRGFPKARTLEGMLAALPDKIESDGQEEDVRITVANIRAEADLEIARMRLEGAAQDDEKDREHDLRRKGVDILADSLMEKMRRDGAEPSGPAREQPGAAPPQRPA